MYKNEQIPDSYNKIADFSDNYIVWVEESKLNSGTNYSAYIQYFEPCFQLIYTDNYRITKGDTYSFDYNYVSNGLGGEYIDSADYNFSYNTLVPDDDYISSSYFETRDFPSIFICQVLFAIIFVWCFKQLSRLFFKGGLA